jgi:hypothetical protein
MSVDFLLKVIQLYGFPAVMCLWFMIRLEKRLDKIAEDNHRQVVVLAVLVRTMSDRRAPFGTFPDDFMDEVTGVTEIPVPPASATEEVQGSKKKGAGS